MRCLSPISILVDKYGSPLTEKRKKLYNQHDINMLFHYVQVPCGRCYACLSRRRREWSFRCMQEEKTCISSYFVTLTYRNCDLPHSIHAFKSDAQNWLKRVRNLVGFRTVRYLIVSDYGHDHARPHLHCIIWNLPLKEDMLDVARQTWHKGDQVFVGTVTRRSINYTLKYVFQKSDDNGSHELFLLSSRRPAIGCNFLTADNIDRVRHYGNVWHTSASDEQVPRYYKNKIFSHKESLAIGKRVSEDVDSAEQALQIRFQRKYGDDWLKFYNMYNDSVNMDYIRRVKDTLNKHHSNNI